MNKYEWRNFKLLTKDLFISDRKDSFKYFYIINFYHIFCRINKY